MTPPAQTIAVIVSKATSTLRGLAAAFRKNPETARYAESCEREANEIERIAEERKVA